jgi:hypothetical protein
MSVNNSTSTGRNVNQNMFNVSVLPLTRVDIIIEASPNANSALSHGSIPFSLLNGNLRSAVRRRHTWVLLDEHHALLSHKEAWSCHCYSNPRCCRGSSRAGSGRSGRKTNTAPCGNSPSEVVGVSEGSHSRECRVLLGIVSIINNKKAFFSCSSTTRTKRRSGWSNDDDRPPHHRPLPPASVGPGRGRCAVSFDDW